MRIANEFQKNVPTRSILGRIASANVWPIRLERCMEKPTPETLYDLFVRLSDEETGEFLEKIACEVSAESIFLMWHKLDPIEGKKFADLYFQEVGWQVFPILLRDARKFAREHPDMPDEEFDRLFLERNKESQENYDRKIHELEKDTLKKQRDRKSDPETILKNVQICDLRRQNKHKWSQKVLAKQFGITDRAIRGILRKESYWRRLASQLKSS